MDLAQQTADACDQLQRYSYGVFNHELLAVLQAITDINDDLWHGRDPALVKQNIEKAIAMLGLVPYQ